MTQENLVKKAYFNNVKRNFDDPTFINLWDNGSLVKFEVRPKYRSLDQNKISITIYERKRIKGESDVKIFRTISYIDLKEFFDLIGIHYGIKFGDKKLKGIRLTNSQYDKILGKLIENKNMIVLTFNKKSVSLSIEDDPYYCNNNTFFTSANFPKALKDPKANKNLQQDLDNIKEILLSFITQVKNENTANTINN